MQIHNNIGSYTNAEYPHTHHMTQCLHEQEQKQQQSAAGDLKNNTLSQTSTELQEEIAGLQGMGAKEAGRGFGVRKGIGFLKGIWEAMGQDNSHSTAGAKAMLPAETAAAGTAYRMPLPQRMRLRVTELREKLRVGIYTTLRRFNKEKENFTAMSDRKQHSTAGKKSPVSERTKETSNIGHEELNLKVMQKSNSHLMDSYSKNGEYCQINENLTYSQKQGFQDTKKTMEGNRHGL